MERNKTTDLDKVRFNHSCFTWGKVIQIYDLINYTIIEYVPTGQEYHRFYCYFDGKSLGNSHTLDGALIICIARANLGKIQYADWAPIAVNKILNIPSG